MKKWIGFVIICVLVILSSYYGMGVGTERILKRNVGILSQSNGVEVVLHHYQRGWFRSHADLKWTVSIPQPSSDQTVRRTVFPSNKVYVFEIPLEIHHGPMMWVNYKLFFGLGYAHATAHLPAAYQKELNSDYNYNAEKLEYTVNVLVNYLNKTTVQFKIPQYKLTAKKGDNFFQWLGMATNIVVSSDKQHLEGDLSLKGLSWYTDGMKGLLGPVRASYDMRQGIESIYIGTADLNFPSLVVFHDEKPIFRLSDFQIHSNSDIKHGLFNSSITSKVNQLVMWDKVYSHNALDVSFQNLDAHVLAVMNRKMSEFQHSTNDKQRLLWTLVPDLPSLLSKGAQLNIDNYEMTMLEGHVKANLSLSLPNESLTNPLQLAQKITGESHLRVSKLVLSKWLESIMQKAMVAQIQKQSLAKEMQAPVTSESPGVPTKNTSTLPSMTTVGDDQGAVANAQLKAKVSTKIQEWVHEGILVEEGDDYLILFTLMNGKLLINGHPFNPTLLAA